MAVLVDANTRVITQGFTLRCLILFTEMSAAAFISVQCIFTHQFT